MKTKFHDRFNPPPSIGIDFSDSPSLTKQEFEPECNINNILAKFKVTGVLVDPSVRSLRQPMFIDTTSVPDLESYHAKLQELTGQFEALPKEVQEAFGFDARIAMQWLSNASDRQVVQLFEQLSVNPVDGSSAGAGGAVSPQSKPDSSDDGAAQAATNGNDSPTL